MERNLREMFRLLAAGKRAGEVREAAGVTVASAGSSFQMFNAAFFNSPVLDHNDLERRIALAQTMFTARGLPWSLWVCEEYLPEELRPRLKRSCERAGLHLGSEMPAMTAERIVGDAAPRGGTLEIRPVESAATLRDFCQVGAACFRVPLPWFEQVFDSASRLRGAMRGWVGVCERKAVATVATVMSDDAVGVYNLATMMPFRERGIGEAMLRHAVGDTSDQNGRKPVVLQATRQGLRLYKRLGFRSVGRILVFPSR